MNIPRKHSSLIPASALGYAISFLLLIALIGAGVLFVSSANKRLQVNFEIQEHMLLNNYLGLKYGASKVETGTMQLVYSSGDTSDITVRNWGAYRVVVSQTKHGQRKVNKSAIVGDASDFRYPTVYLPNQRQKLKLCGETKIEGLAMIPERSLERGYIAGKNYSLDKLLYGEEQISDKQLPKLKDKIIPTLEDIVLNSIKIDPLDVDSSFSFTEATRLVSTVEELFVSNKLKGNLILHSFQKITIGTDAVLENVILMAPEVQFEKGFSGSVQVVANRRIVCEEGVTLSYPSALMLSELEFNNAEQNGIFLAPRTQVIGGILLASNAPNFRRPVQLVIDEAVVGGLVYNVGETELRGKLIGSLYTNSFSLNVGGGQYVNYLLDATLSKEMLPKDFVYPKWIDLEESSNPKIIACF